MKITRLHLENFRGIKELDIDFGPIVTNIYGANGTGKTTIANAVSWLLFGKAATGEKDFNPKTVGVHDLHHLAEVTFQAENGRIVRLKKDFYEIWSKKKGSKTKTFSGNTTDYWVDDIPYKENVYTKTIQSLCGGTLEIAKLLTMYDYFPEVMNVEERRKVLFEVCGDMTDEEVIAQTPELADLQTFLKQPGTSGQMYTPDEYKKIAMDQRRKLNDNLKMLPARIDEVTKSIPETLPDEKKIQKKIATLQEQSNGIDADIREIQNGDTQALAIQKKIAALSTELEQSRMAFTEKVSAEYQKQYAQQAKIQKQGYALDEEYAKASAELKKQVATVEDMKQQRNRLLREFSEVQASQWDEGQQICPTCHRPLAADKVAEMRKQFNAAKSAHLENINERGKLCGKEVIGSLEAQINTIKKSMEQIGADKMVIDKNKEAVHRILANQLQFENTKIYIKSMQQLRELEDQNIDSNTVISAAIEKKKQQKEALQIQIQVTNRTLAAIDAAKRAQQRIDELQQEQRQNGADLEELEHGLYLCDEFTRAKVRMITDNINNRFHFVHFKLFEEQLNGGLKELCEPMVQNEVGAWVDYRSANTAAQVNAGMDIISVLSDFYNIHLPVFIDRAESVTVIQNADNTQLIRLIVSPDDATLRVENK
ncbi:AAA family ATPase [Megasphaera sueciensis]|uniref:AAA family ATPase n=1 Tax=Megasphaera sueciensis TaxID=349094 RepID=UPI003D09311B